MPSDIRTLTAEFRHEIEPVKGSRFLTTAAPAATPAAAGDFLARVRAEFPRATHHCSAYRLGRGGEVFRSSDDGEPSGSAGRPILLQIEGHGLTDLVVVVTRWFGGTKLGVGGLMRAYGGAAGQTLDRAPVRVVVLTRRIAIEHPYECSGPIEGLFRAHGLTPMSVVYEANVRIVVEVPEDFVSEFTRALRDRAAGRASVTVEGA